MSRPTMQSQLEAGCRDPPSGDFGLIRPERLRITEEDKQTVIQVDQVLARSEEKAGKERELIMRCQGVIGERMQVLELKYRVGECRWYLYRM